MDILQCNARSIEQQSQGRVAGVVVPTTLLTYNLVSPLILQQMWIAPADLHQGGVSTLRQKVLLCVNEPDYVYSIEYDVTFQ